MNLINKTFVTITDKIKGNSLKARSARGVVTLGIGTVAERGLRFVRNMILARLLAPEQFGLMAIVMAGSMALEAFTDVGVKQSVIHNKKGDKAEYLNVAWWFQAVRGLGLFAVAYISAPWISHFYESAELLPLMRFAFVAILFNSLISPRVHVLEKKIHFGKLVFLSQGSGLLGTLISLGLAFFVVRNVWALVIGYVAEVVIRCSLSFVLCPFRPRLSFDRGCLSELLRFARGMLGLAFLTVVIRQTDILVLGKVVSGEQLGMYYLALQLAYQPVLLFERMIGKVLLPAFAEKQDDKESIRRAMLTIVKTTAVFGVPLLAFLIICAGPILSLVYGSPFGAVSVPFSFLCLWALVTTQAIGVGSVLIGVGMPHLHRRAVALRAVILIGLIYPAIRFWGLSGAAGAVLVAYSVALVPPFLWMRWLINLKLNEYALSWLPGFWASLVVIVPTILLRYSSGTKYTLSMIVGIISCLGAWLVGLLLLKRSRLRQACLANGA